MTVARSRTTDQRYYGLAEAIVVDVNDPLHEGRVKLKFPWFDPDMVTDWSRVCQLYAGNGYGSLFVPEENDEVLVAFVHGDMRLPIVLGGLYNGKDKPATFHATDRDQKLVRTKGGHEILLDDTQNEKKVRVRTSGGHTVELDDQKRRLTITSTGGQSIELDDAGGRVVIGTSGGVSITMDGTSVSVQAQSVSVQAQSVSLKAPSVQLGPATPEAILLGHAFSAFFDAHFHTLTPTGATTPPTVPSSSIPALLSQTVKVI